MNDLELIRHWCLREDFELTLALLVVMLLLTAIFAGLAFCAVDPRACWTLAAVGDALLSATLIWRLVVIRRRLRALEDLIP